MSMGGLKKRMVSIRIKILIPFIVAMGIMAMASLYLSMGFISSSVEEKLMDEYQKKSTFFSSHVDRQSQLIAIYSNLILKRLTAQKQASDCVPDALLDRDHLTVIPNVDQLSDIQYKRYKDLIDSTPPNTFKSAPMVFSEGSRGDAVLVSVIKGPSIKGRPSEVAVIELPLSYASLMESLDANYIENIGLIYITPQSDPVFVASSPMISASTTLTGMVFSHVKTAYADGNSDYVGEFLMDGVPYNIIVKKQSFSIPLYSVVLVPLISVSDVVRHIVIGTIGFLAVVSLCLILIYALIIRKITTSIDILTDVAQKVSKGDLNQQVFVTAQDEVGHLSMMFNRMISHLKKSSSRLIQEKNQSEAIVTSIPECILVTDLEFNLILANHSAETLFEFLSHSVFGQSVISFIKHKSLAKALKVATKSATYPLVQEVTFKHQGHQKSYLMTSTALLNEDDEKKGIVSVLRDVTREREVDQLRDSFLRTVSHELRTPLTSIIGFLELVKDDPSLSKDKRRFLEIALDESISLKDLINDLLDLSRIEAGTMKLEFAPIVCDDLLTNLVLALSPLTKGKPLQLSANVPDKSLTVSADLSKLRRVLVNLISNAIKFTPTGTIIVSCESRAKDILFTVSDTGIGLLDNEKSIIFEKFRQVDSSDTRKYEGIGLGLSIVRELVELHKGKIWVESVYGKGSTFFFTIPHQHTEG